MTLNDLLSFINTYKRNERLSVKDADAVLFKVLFHNLGWDELQDLKKGSPTYFGRYGFSHAQILKLVGILKAEMYNFLDEAVNEVKEFQIKQSD